MQEMTGRLDIETIEAVGGTRRDTMKEGTTRSQVEITEEVDQGGIVEAVAETIIKEKDSMTTEEMKEAHIENMSEMEEGEAGQTRDEETMIEGVEAILKAEAVVMKDPIQEGRRTGEALLAIEGNQKTATTKESSEMNEGQPRADQQRKKEVKANRASRESEEHQEAMRGRT